MITPLLHGERGVDRGTDLRCLPPDCVAGEDGLLTPDRLTVVASNPHTAVLRAAPSAPEGWRS